MALVGDVLMGLREAAPDLPTQTIASPPNLAPLVSAATTGGLLQVGFTYYVKPAFLTPWGETIPGVEINGTILAANNALTTSIVVPPGVTAVKLYFGTSSGANTSCQIFPVAMSGMPTGLNMTLSGIGAIPGSPTSRNSAYLPDVDGRSLNTSRLYSWLNDGLQLGAQIAGGGIPDMSGVGSVSGQPWYLLTGNWKKIDTAWYDGYPLYLGRKTDVFRRNKVTGTVGTLIVDYYAEAMKIELWPQPSRTSGQTTTNAAMLATDNSIALVASNFTLGIGLVQFGSGSLAELASFSSNASGVLSGMIRGWGGTRAQAWAAGTAVTELNIMLAGFRHPSRFGIGDGYRTLDVPPGWEAALQKYMLHRFRDAERKRKEAKDLLNEFTAAIQNLRTNKQFAGPVQIQANAGRGSETYPGLGGPFGGVIVP